MRIIPVAYCALLVCFIFIKIYWHNRIIRCTYRLTQLEMCHASLLKQQDHFRADYIATTSWEKVDAYAHQKGMSLISLSHIKTITQPLSTTEQT